MCFLLIFGEVKQGNIQEEYAEHSTQCSKSIEVDMYYNSQTKIIWTVYIMNSLELNFVKFAKEFMEMMNEKLYPNCNEWFNYLP